MSDEMIANYVHHSNHNTAASSADAHDVMSRDDATVDSQSRRHCDDVIAGVAPLPLLLPSATGVRVPAISYPSPCWLESVDRCHSQLSLAVCTWRVMLANMALRAATDVDRSLPNHDVRAATGDDLRQKSVDTSSCRFHPNRFSYR